MNEYKIHQRFFAKLKQKADRKKKDIEEKGKKDNKENIQKAEQRSSPEHPYRKRSVPPLEEKPVVKNSAAAEQPGDVVESKAVASDSKDTGDMTSVNSSLEKEESEETLAKKRLKMSNGVDTGENSSISRSPMMGNGGENSYDGGLSLAHFLAETIQSQSADENQEEKTKETCAATLRDNKENDTEEINNKLEEQDKEEYVREKKKEEELVTGRENKSDKKPEQDKEEYVREKKREEELVIQKEKKTDKQPEMAHTTSHSKVRKSSNPDVKHSKGQKDHDQHNIQTSISSMLHSVKDFFFGKSKKDSHNISHAENEDEYFDHSTVLPEPEPDMPPSFQPQAEHSSGVLANDVVPMDTNKAEELSESLVRQAAAGELIKFNCEDADPPHDPKLLPEIVKESAGKSDGEANEAVEAMEVSREAERSSPEERKSLSGFQVHAEVSRCWLPFPD